MACRSKHQSPWCAVFGGTPMQSVCLSVWLSELLCALLVFNTKLVLPSVEQCLSQVLLGPLPAAQCVRGISQGSSGTSQFQAFEWRVSACPALPVSCAAYTSGSCSCVRALILYADPGLWLHLSACIPALDQPRHVCVTVSIVAVSVKEDASKALVWI